MIKTKNYILFVFVFLLVVFIAVFSTSVTARPVGEFGAAGLAISPAVIKVTAKQGEMVETEIRIGNMSRETIKAEIRVVDFEKHGNQIVFLDEYKDIRISPASWIELTSGNVSTLQPGEWTTVKAIVNVPEEALMGEHAAAVRLTKKEDDKAMTGGAGAKISTALSIPFYVRVTDEQGNLDIDESWTLNWVKGKFWNGREFTLSLTNLGNVHLVSEGKFTIYDWWADEIIEEFVPYVNFLPGTTKEIVLSWQKPKRLGIFKAQIEVTMDGGKRYEYYESWFVRVPNFVVITVIVVFLVTVAIISLYLHYMKKRMERELRNKIKDNQVK